MKTKGGEFKPSGRAGAIGFDPVRLRYVGHPRSRWHGNHYWLCASPHAIPKSVREKGERAPLSPLKIANVVRPSVEVWDEGSVIEIKRWKLPRYGNFPLAAPVLADAWSASLLAAAVNPHFLSWINRHTGPGEWWICSSEAGPLRPFIKTVKRDVVAVLMPIRVADAAKLHRLTAVEAS